MEQAWRVQTIGRQNAPMHRVMQAQTTHQLAAQTLVLRADTDTRSTRISGHQKSQRRPLTRRAGAAPWRLGHARRDSPHVHRLQAQHRPQRAHQQQTLPVSVLMFKRGRWGCSVHGGLKGVVWVGRAAAVAKGMLGIFIRLRRRQEVPRQCEGDSRCRLFDGAHSDCVDAVCCAKWRAHRLNALWPWFDADQITGPPLRVRYSRLAL